MKKRLLVIYIAIVALPLAAMAWLGVALAQRDQAIVEVRIRDLLTDRLHDVRATIANVIADRERAIMAAGAHAAMPPDELRAIAFDSGLVQQFFICDGTGALLYPAPTASLSDNERAFLIRTQSVWENGEIPAAAPEGTTAPRGAKAAAPPPRGWHAGYWEQGIRLLYWWTDGPGRIVGAEVNDMRLAADIVAALPAAAEYEADTPLADGRIELVDEGESVLYQWGGYLAQSGERPAATVSLPHPLHYWELRYYASPATAIQTRGVWYTVLPGLLAVALALLVLAAYFYREHTRAMREAVQRVSFVNQVSHELKTPLTNIRLYAELLNEDLQEADPQSAKRLNVIVSESQRLSRLIGNVLTFSRETHQGLALRPAPGVVDDSVRQVLNQFEETMRSRGVTVSLDAGAPDTVSYDADAVEQILGNLLSNVEKYAGSPASVRIETRQQNGETTITVEDDGPGIPPEHRTRVFQAFYRVSDRVHDGVAGVGLGLTIARRLAGLHGGGLTLAAADRGTRFVVSLHTPRVHGGQST